MNGASPERPDLPMGSPSSHISRGVRDLQAADTPPDNRAAPEDASEADHAAGEDEILRSGQSGNTDRGVGRTAPTGGRAQATGTSGVRRLPRATNEIYAGWLPTDKALTGREVAFATFVAGALSAVFLVSLVLAERWATLPVSAGGNGPPLALSIGLFCGLYVLLQLRARRLAWRQHLTGDGP